MGVVSLERPFDGVALVTMTNPAINNLHYVRF